MYSLRVHMNDCAHSCTKLPDIPFRPNDLPLHVHIATVCVCVCVWGGGVDTDSNVLYVHSVHDVLLIVSVYTCVCTLPIVQCMYCRSVQCYHVSSCSVGEARKCCLVMMYTYCFSFWHKVYMMLSILHFLFGQLIKDLNTSICNCKLGV